MEVPGDINCTDILPKCTWKIFTVTSGNYLDEMAKEQHQYCFGAILPLAVFKNVVMNDE